MLAQNAGQNTCIFFNSTFNDNRYIYPNLRIETTQLIDA